ncbi:MAG TPA: NAD(P)-dependent alcohol dehydrogenase [Chthoniobacteraceae bacterium]|jgi:NADPH:quinone reductase-like Zn-dependent oxidoreductase|nr:NAD(P)-dependent alcohol dehydrogenase [Chthoniobacteraceae bacterium]
MNQWVIQEYGGPTGLAQVESQAPVPAAREVVVRVRAVSLNYRDLLNLKAARPGSLPLPFVPCSDGAGEVIAVGSEVVQWKPGDRVAGIFFRDWTGGPFELAYHKCALGGSAPGMLAEQVVLPEHALVRIPEHLSDAEAACLPCAGVTAWQALFTRGGLQAGRTVLALGTGGVSIFALQLATAAGARVIITSSSDEKLARARELGAAEGVNYRTSPDWDKEVWRLSGKRGVDHVVEVGGPGTLEKSLNCVAAGGQVALIGVLTGFGPPTATLFPLTARNARMDGIYVGSRADFEALDAFLTEHRIHPVIDRIFPWKDAPAAYAHLESGSHFGKVVIVANGS